MDLTWWIAVIGVPLVGVIFFCIGAAWRHADQVKLEASRGDERLHSRIDQLVAVFGTYQTDAAKYFAVRDETNQNLRRIEEKIDRLVERKS